MYIIQIQFARMHKSENINLEKLNRGLCNLNVVDETTNMANLETLYDSITVQKENHTSPKSSEKICYSSTPIGRSM